MGDLIPRLVCRLLTRAWALPRATHAVDVMPAVPAPMRDGVTLLADVHRPRGLARAPVVLLRSPYGRGFVFGWLARLFAERGYVAVVQSVRGTFGSGGRFDPFFQERDDGLDTLDWIERQAWYGDRLGLVGTSYLGIAAWALAVAAGPRVHAIAIAQASSDVHAAIYGGRAFHLADALLWTTLVASQQRVSLPRLVARVLRAVPRLKRDRDDEPVVDLDRRRLGETLPFWRAWAGRSDVDDPGWLALRDHDRLDRVTAPTSLVAGWMDVFVDGQLRDFEALARLERPVRLTVGPWAHAAGASPRTALADALDWFERHLRAPSGPPRGPATERLWVEGANTWVERRSDRARGEQLLRLGADGRLEARDPAPGTRCFRYRGDDPTPGIGGPSLADRNGRADQAPLLRRADVVVFDGPGLTAPIEIDGRVSVVLAVSASAPTHGLFACLCEVDDRGRSWNIVDGHARLDQAWPSPWRDVHTVREVHIGLLPTARRIAAGRRLRLIVAGGAWPRFARTVEPAAIDIALHCGLPAGSLLRIPTAVIDT